MIVGDTTPLTIGAEATSSAVRVICDGTECFTDEDAGGLPLHISLAARHLSLVLRPGYTYFELVRTKLGWSGNNIPEGV